MTIAWPKSPSELTSEIAALSDADLLRLQAIARLRARGLPGVDGADLLHEALLRLLDGSRARPNDVPLLSILVQTMRSIAHDHLRRVTRERRLLLAVGEQTAAAQPDRTAAADPERALAAAQALADVDRLFAADAVALKIVAAMADGLKAEEIRQRLALDEKTYDSARRRMRRALLRRALLRRDGGGGRP